MKFDDFSDRLISKAFPKLYKKMIDSYFNNDTSFYEKLNVNIATLYRRCRNANIKFVKHDSEKGKLYFIYKNSINLVTDYSVGNLVEIFAIDEYLKSRNMLNDGEYVVFDIGMNKGFSSMYFALSPNVSKVIGFEIDPRLRLFIDENLAMNTELGKKIDVNSFGLSKEDGEIDLYVLEQDDGVTTMDPQFFNNYWSDERKEKAKKVSAQVKNASEVIKSYMNKYPDKKFMMTIDVEGAEYDIFNNLKSSGIFEKFSVINGEYHNGIQNLVSDLDGFEVVENTQKKADNQVQIGTFILKRRY